MSSHQNKCNYCDTPASRVALKCKTCGSPLPIMLPKGWAKKDGKLIYKRSPDWSLRKAGFICASASAALGLLSGFAVFAMIALAWVALFTPVIMVSATWRNARNNMVTLAGNAAISLGVWLLCIIILMYFSRLSGGAF